MILSIDDAQGYVKPRPFKFSHYTKHGSI